MKTTTHVINELPQIYVGFNFRSWMKKVYRSLVCADKENMQTEFPLISIHVNAKETCEQGKSVDVHIAVFIHQPWT